MAHSISLHFLAGNVFFLLISDTLPLLQFQQRDKKSKQNEPITGADISVTFCFPGRGFSPVRWLASHTTWYSETTQVSFTALFTSNAMGPRGRAGGLQEADGGQSGQE